MKDSISWKGGHGSVFLSTGQSYSEDKRARHFRGSMEAQDHRHGGGLGLGGATLCMTEMLGFLPNEMGAISRLQAKEVGKKSPLLPQSLQELLQVNFCFN